MRIYNSLVTDNRRWAHFPLRDGDILVCTPPKSGTTWMQVITALLLSGDPEVEPRIATKQPWIDNRNCPVEDRKAALVAQTGPCSLKSHTPLDGLPWHDGCHYLAVYRHPLDAHFSMRNHVANFPPQQASFNWYYPEDERLCFDRFLEGADEGADYDAMSLASIITHYRSFRRVADRPNVHMFHYANMRADLPATMHRVAAILGSGHDAATMDRLIAAAGFANMKANAGRYAPSGGADFWRNDADFFRDATSRKWEGRLTEAELARYDAVMEGALDAEDRRWLEWGTEDQ